MLLVSLLAGAWLLIGATTASVCVLAARGDRLQHGAPVPETAFAEVTPAADTDMLVA